MLAGLRAGHPEGAELLDDWSRYALTEPLAGLIHRIISDTGAYLRFGKRNLQAVFNLDKLLDTAREFDRRGYTTLQDFVEWVKNIRASEQREAAADMTLPGVQGAVSMMTVHKAKGLEFPVVFLPGMNQQPRSVTTGPAVIIEDRGGSARMAAKGSGNPVYAELWEREREELRREHQRAEGGGPSLVGMDSGGKLLYCKPGEPPLFDVLTPPFTQWGKPTRFTIDNNNLYVLDPEKNAVWIYWNMDKATQPAPFFTQDFPPMADVIDLAVDNIDLFLLHADGHITLCNYSDIGVAPTRYTDPLPYIDSRPGREGQPFIPYPAFSQIKRTQPPDPSIYMLDPGEQSIYHFSQRLAYQRQLKPLQPLSPNPDGSITPANAFTFSPDSRIVFLVVGNQVYSAGKP